MINFLNIKFNYIILSILLVILSSCSTIDRPKMAYDQKDKGTVLEMESFNVKTSAENFQKSSSKFSENAKQMKQNNKNTNSNEAVSRRISLTEKKETGSIHALGAKLQGLPSCNGWSFWHVERNGKPVLIDTLRQKVRAKIYPIKSY